MEMGFFCGGCMKSLLW